MSLLLKPRDVIAAVPSRTPPGLMALVSPRTMFLLIEILKLAVQSKKIPDEFANSFIFRAVKTKRT